MLFIKHTFIYCTGHRCFSAGAHFCFEEQIFIRSYGFLSDLPFTAVSFCTHYHTHIKKIFQSSHFACFFVSPFYPALTHGPLSSVCVSFWHNRTCMSVAAAQAFAPTRTYAHTWADGMWACAFAYCLWIFARLCVGCHGDTSSSPAKSWCWDSLWHFNEEDDLLRMRVEHRKEGRQPEWRKWGRKNINQGYSLQFCLHLMYFVVQLD